MTSPDELDLSDSPIPYGVTVLEASAGTGKTFAIAGLWLRMLLEIGISHDRILVVTYTDAAASELRQRIHQRLVAALEAVRSDETTDRFLSAVLHRCREQDPELHETTRRLEQARDDFDEAPIGTIHGFCHRSLRTHAFETGSWFDADLVPDVRVRNKELIRDWWQSLFAQAPLILLAWSGFQGHTPEKFNDLLKELECRPEARRWPPPGLGAISSLQRIIPEEWESLQSLWREYSQELRPFLVNRTDWTSFRGAGIKEFRGQGAILEACLNGEETEEGFQALRAFSPERIAQYAKASTKLPLSHPWMQARNVLVEKAEMWAEALPAAFLEWAAIEIPRRQQAQRQLSYSDLLTGLQHALEGFGGNTLTQALQNEFDAVLVDEFQDTDPIQWNIFQRLFAVPFKRLYLVGDPKQAIYGFRGGDIFTYLDAIRAADHRFSLAVNWRAGGDLVRQLNRFWGQCPRPFVLPEIQFHPVRPAPERELLTLRDDFKPEAPFHVWTCAEADSFNKTEWTYRMASGVASEVVRLLDGSVQMELRPLRPNDIAVLAENRYQLETVADALRRRGIPVVIPTRENVLSSTEAAEFYRFVAGLLESNRESMLRGVLANDLVGLEASELIHLGVAESEWIQWLNRIQSWKALWQLHGPLALFRRVCVDCRSNARWLGLADGERRYTNHLQVAEILQLTSHTRSLGPAGQVQWLQTNLHSAGDGMEETLIRMERDDDAVRLLTLHGSKGLEFPVVFCPFWTKSANPDSRSKRTEPVVFHPNDGTGQSAWDLGTAQQEENLWLSRSERLAENLRLLYVGLTRASRRVYLGWSQKMESGTALGWLLEGCQFPSVREWLENGESNVDSSDRLATLETWCQMIQVRQDEIPTGTLDYRFAPPSDPPPTQVRPFTREIPWGWRMASFSWLTLGGHDSPKDPDPPPLRDDVSEEGGPPLLVSGSLMEFPRGREAGTCLHDILEKWAAAPGPVDVAQLQLPNLLANHGIAGEYATAVGQLLRQLPKLPLTSDGNPLTLSEAGSGERLVELEFCLPLCQLTVKSLSEVLERYSDELPEGFPSAVKRVQFLPVEGALRGLIDLVFRARGQFWIVDWKSNWLGNRPSHYSHHALTTEMTARLYPLQVLLYTLAVDRWLKSRVPDFNYDLQFGGVYYLFLRALDTSVPGQGIYFFRPSPRLIQDLAQLLLPVPEFIA